jgi:erythronate-4-phosphate dehydrogenase
VRIFADENMPLVQQFFSHLGQVTLFDGRHVSAEQLATADVLLVRSVTKVNQSLLHANANLSFVGTATIGLDHIDQAYLSQRQIPFTNAPGCNAQSVVEYVLSSLWFLAQRYQWQLSEKTIAVVGVGNIGSRLAKSLQLLGAKVLLCDPLRQQQEADFEHTTFATVCREADIISFHTPLQTQGEFATQHLVNAQTLAQLKPDCAIINAARGGIIDNVALLAEAETLAAIGKKRPLVLDVWEHEPTILTALLPYLDIATAHIAGHSIEGKARGTEMLYQSLCQQLKIVPKHQLTQFLVAPAIEKVQLNAKFGPPDVQSLARLLYDVSRDDAIFRQQLAVKGFDWIRKTYPARREFSSLQLSGTAVPNWLGQLGFSLEQ